MWLYERPGWLKGGQVESRAKKWQWPTTRRLHQICGNYQEGLWRQQKQNLQTSKKWQSQKFFRVVTDTCRRLNHVHGQFIIKSITDRRKSFGNLPEKCVWAGSAFSIVALGFRLSWISLDLNTLTEWQFLGFSVMWIFVIFIYGKRLKGSFPRWFSGKMTHRYQ